MVGIRKSLLALSILVALPSPAAAADVCAALSRIITSSRETPRFASVRRELENGESVIPGFQAAACGVSATAIDCEVNAFSISNFDDWPDLGACLGVEPENRQEASAGLRRDWNRAYVVSGLRIEYGVHCIGCAGLARGRVWVGLEGSARPND
jgi:hypothetical protein